MYTEDFNPLVPLDVVKLYKQEVMEIRKLAGYMGIWQLFQTANILCVPIQSVCPSSCSSNDTKSDMNIVVYCSDAAYNNDTPIKIMWTPTQIKKQRPCHFVPLLKVVRKDIHKKHMYVKIHIQQILMICLTFYICSCVKLPAHTKAVEKVTTKSQSKESDVKILEEEDNEEKPVVCKTCVQKVGSGSRGRGCKTQPRKQATKSKDEIKDVKPDIKQISVKDVSVMIRGLSKDEVSPEKKQNRCSGNKR